MNEKQATHLLRRLRWVPFVSIAWTLMYIAAEEAKLPYFGATLCMVGAMTLGRELRQFVLLRDTQSL